MQVVTLARSAIYRSLDCWEIIRPAGANRHLLCLPNDMFRTGDGVARDDAKAFAHLKRACDGGYSEACRWLDEEHRGGRGG